ncbi:MAG: phenylalanine 4-monooxygenase [Oceanospirillaceae bacterium]|nr:phenylalanine 4-monooxygenase [Oceanospirillaceae bacterium]
MTKTTHYKAKQPDENGIIHYSHEENNTWQLLIKRQLKLIKHRACDEFLTGLDKLNLPLHCIPQLSDIDATLQRETGWQTSAVPALINFDRFFALLADRKFPVATFIRTRQEIDYVQEPDIFHEIFGHCPLLTNPDFARFTENYGKLAMRASKQERQYLARLYWFTVEFGLLETAKGLRIYGGGILSSKEEVLYAVESEQALKIAFNTLDVLRTPYRIDVLQAIYFKIGSMADLSAISKLDLLELVAQAKKLGPYRSLYPELEHAS